MNCWYGECHDNVCELDEHESESGQMVLKKSEMDIFWCDVYHAKHCKIVQKKLKHESESGQMVLNKSEMDIFWSDVYLCQTM